MRAKIFKNKADDAAFEKILHEGLQIHHVELFSYLLMPNHYHLVLRPLVDGEMSRFMGWIGGTHAMRYHAHCHTSGPGHLYQQRYKSFPIQDDEHFLVVCRYVERNALRANLVKRAEEWHWSSLWRWLQRPEPEPKLLSAWPLARLPNWVARVNEALSKHELLGLRPPIRVGRERRRELAIRTRARCSWCSIPISFNPWPSRPLSFSTGKSGPDRGARPTAA